MKPDNFIDIPQTWNNISMYVMGTCIWKAVQTSAQLKINNNQTIGNIY